MGLCESLVRCCWRRADPEPACEALLQHTKGRNVAALLEVERDAKSDFSKRFVLGRKLGAGAFATVYECGDITTKKTYACKVYKRHGIDSGSLECALTEPLLLKRLYHPGILRCQGFYKEPQTYVLVMEELKGGDIFAKLHQSKEKLTEQDICRLVKMFLEALQYIHARNIVHRDLKLENLMLDSTGKDSCLKIVDFGFAVQLADDDAQLTEILGTPGYMAPEVILGKPYGKRADIWSAGVIVYTLLCGYPPFHHDHVADVQKLFRCICYGYYFFDSPYWDDISYEAKDLVGQMLKVAPEERKTATELLQHAWFQQNQDMAPVRREQIDMFKAIGTLKSFHRIMKARIAQKQTFKHSDSMTALVESKMSRAEKATKPITVNLRRSTLLPTARGVVSTSSEKSD